MTQILKTKKVDQLDPRYLRLMALTY